MDKSKIESAFPLTELQSVMLFQHLKSPDDDIGFLQLQVILKGTLDVSALIKVWNHMTSTYEVLRTTIHWEKIKQQVQIVHKKIKVDIDYQDCRQLSQTGAENKINEFLKADRKDGLNLSEAPCWRLTLFQIDSKTYRFVWSCHHILLDGWSGLELLNKMRKGYNQLKQNGDITFNQVPSFQTYFRWLKQQPETLAARYWRSQFAELSDPKLLVGECAGSNGTFETASFPSDVFATERLRETAQVFKVTPSALLFGAWAIIVSELTQSSTVVIGITVSGRSAPIEGIESMLGMLANTLPLYLKIDQKMSTKNWFHTVFKQLQELGRFEHNSLGQIYRWTDIPPHTPLFDSILIHANQPWEQETQIQYNKDQIEITELKGDVTSAHPITLMVQPGTSPTLEISFDNSQIKPEFCHFIAHRFQEILSNVYDQKNEPIETLIKQAPEAYICPLCPKSPVDTSAANKKESNEKWSDTELRLREIWSQILGSHKVTLHGNFFDLGGSSFMVLNLLNVLKEQYDIIVPMERFIKHPTIPHLAEWIESNQVESKQITKQSKSTKQLNDSTDYETFRALVERTDRERSSPFKDPYPYSWKDQGYWLECVANWLPYTLFSGFHKWLLSYYAELRTSGRILKIRKAERIKQTFFECLNTDVDKHVFLRKNYIYKSLNDSRLPLIAQGLSRKKNAPLAKQAITNGRNLLKTAIDRKNGVLIVQCHDNGNARQPLREMLPKKISQVEYFLVGNPEIDVRESGLDGKVWLAPLASHMLAKAEKTLKNGGIVSMSGDGPPTNDTTAIERRFHGRKRLFPTGYAHLALTTKASVFMHFNFTDENGNMYPKIFGPLNKGNESEPYDIRIESLVDQYLKLLHQMWSEMPWMVDTSQMIRHIEYSQAL